MFKEQEFEIYHIAFYKIKDTNLWNRSSLYKTLDILLDRLKYVPYIDSSTLVLKEIELPKLP